MNELITDPSELYKLFSDNPNFKKWLSDTIFSLTYKKKKELPE
jgi:type I restriction enzyme R subunit